MHGKRRCSQRTLLNAGTYWVNLQNAVVNTGDPVYWDENSGPSLASESSVGTIPSESFTILGEATTTTTIITQNAPCPPEQNGFQEVHGFRPDAETTGVAADSAGNLYGAIANGGSQGAGLLYELGLRSSNWFFSTLYSFLGGSDGDSPGSLLVGPDGSLYGTAAGEIQDCGLGSSACGLIWRAQPRGAACVSAACGWNETVLYQFTGNTDAWGGVVKAFDSAGNLYGISPSGGAYGNGALFELSPSNGGWTETILHSFTGGFDGGGPNSLLMSSDGSLYGAAGGGGPYGAGVIFQFVHSGSSWTENVIHIATGGAHPVFSGPGSLIEDGAGGFYGVGSCISGFTGYCGAEPAGNGLIFDLTRSGDGWTVNVLHIYENGECWNSNYGHYGTLAISSEGRLYATESAGIFLFCSGIVDVAGATAAVFGPPGMFTNLTADANGNLYGTSPTCGFGTPFGTSGMLWQFTPQFR